MRKVIKLKNVLGLAFGISVVIGGTIGAGILRTPGSIAAILPNKWLILSCWLLTGVYILLSASSYAELTTMLPKAGGAFNYIQRAFGRYAGFFAGWSDYLSNIIAPAFFCMVLGEYTALLFPSLNGQNTLVALSYLTLFTLINLPGIKSSSTVQQITSTLKIALLVVLIVGCFIKGPAVDQAALTAHPQLLTGGILIAFFKAMQLILNCYDGWMSVAFFAEEDNDPARNIPRSYFIGILTIIVIYVSINAAILYVLPLEEVAKSPLAASAAAAVAFGAWSSSFINIIAVFSVASILNTCMLIPSRILFGLSREGFFASKGTTLNKGGTPYYSLLISYAVAFVLIISNSYEQLFGLAAIVYTIITAFTFSSLLQLRKKEPDLLRPYKVWGYPYVTIFVLLITLILFVGFAFSDPRSFLILAILAVFSYPIYKWIVKTTDVTED